MRDKIHIADAKPLPPKDEDARREKIFAGLTDGKDRLILCLPEIANAEAERADACDRVGWALFHDLSSKWLHKRAYTLQKDNKEERIYDNGGQDPTHVSWECLLQYQRVRNTCDALIKKTTLFSSAAKQTLTKILRKEGAFTKEKHTFSHSQLDWKQWRSKAFQSEWYNYKLSALNPNGKPDGFFVAIGGFTIFALADECVLKDGDRLFRVSIEKISLFLFDGFDFEDDQLLGWWRCSPHHDFSVTWGEILENKMFRAFRNRTDYGCDFRVIAPPKEFIVDGDMPIEFFVLEE